MRERERPTPHAVAALERVLGVSAIADGSLDVAPDSQWRNQWGAIFGGYVAGVLVHALERAAPDGQQLSIAHVCFVNALRAEPARASVETVRRGRTASCLEARLHQDGRVSALATGWTSGEPPGQPARYDRAPPPAGAPEEHAARSSPELEPGEALSFSRNHFEVREVAGHDGPASEPVRRAEWYRLPALAVADDEPMPLGGLALVADMIGGPQYHTAKDLLGTQPALLSLDLSLHIFAAPLGPWLLSATESAGVAHGRAIATGACYDASRALVATVAQQSLVRPMGVF